MLIHLLRALPFFFCLSFINHTDSKLPSPLAKFSQEWNDSKYSKCNTADNVNYMSSREKEIIYILNLLRTDPKLFANTVVKKYPEVSGSGYLRKTKEYKSLMNTLQKMKPLPLLNPDQLCYASAQCHAYSSGRRSYIGHDRKESSCRSKKHFDGECCDYGHDVPIDIVMSLLVDERVPSLIHRMICLGDFKKMGASIQPHKAYRNNAVLDFVY
ncbi:MAG TPA: hypothetical protein VGQ09_20705 [Chitinophagaceae bacterium]|jgi:hypothetical protein|nr:hypothetical protein [Chitinophagaceae bacterium]